MKASIDKNHFINIPSLNQICGGDGVTAKAISTELFDKKQVYLILDGITPVLRKLKLEVELGLDKKRKRLPPFFKGLENILIFTFDTLFYYILPMFSNHELDESLCRKLRVSGVFKLAFRYNEPNTDLQYLIPILAYYESSEGSMVAFPETINELVLLKCTLEEQPQTNILLPPNTLPIDITTSGSYETNENFYVFLLSDVFDIIDRKHKHLKNKLHDIDTNVFHCDGYAVTPTENNPLKKPYFLSTKRLSSFRYTVNNLYQLVIDNQVHKVNSNSKINEYLRDRYNHMEWLLSAQESYKTESYYNLNSSYSEMYIAAIFEMMRSELHQYSNKTNIYLDLEELRKNKKDKKGWGESSIMRFIKEATEKIQL